MWKNCWNLSEATALTLRSEQIQGACKRREKVIVTFGQNRCHSEGHLTCKGIGWTLALNTFGPIVVVLTDEKGGTIQLLVDPQKFNLIITFFLDIDKFGVFSL